ncbi:ATP/GTP-binding protein [Candidatus Albibeggiatoa sp. nov. NOAA]|uniref:GTP-binding protein n=1 Tax=Candidatus Albibeggiatoa sp. nov. NOAA TaxID=3162724 RepID=UPI0032F6279B|nr:ATP/GTP-binding protein [Thiotrichaceae bacterium]
MNEHKVVFTGSLGAGKTTAIASISEIPVINTDIQTSDFTKPVMRQIGAHSSTPSIEVANRSMTTVAMDYGEVNLELGKKLRLYGTPGQQRFDYMWKVLIHGAQGLVIFVDNAGTDPIGDLARYTDIFREYILTTHTVVAVTRMDLVPRPSIQVYHNYLHQLGIQLPVFSVDARSSESVANMVGHLVEMINGESC